MLVRPLLSLAMASTILIGGVNPAPKAAPASAALDGFDGPAFTADKQLRFPEKYREWIYVGSGVDMSYDPREGASEHSTFNTVFVNPTSYREFVKTGTWPNGTALVLENSSAVHGGEHQASINKHGLTQTAQITGLEVHVKDASLPGGWGFYSFENMTSAKLIPKPASCYTCHEQHGAVDTTFSQFYPTLIKIATDKKTLSEAYTKEMAAPAK